MPTLPTFTDQYSHYRYLPKWAPYVLWLFCFAAFVGFLIGTFSHSSEVGALFTLAVAFVIGVFLFSDIHYEVSLDRRER